MEGAVASAAIAPSTNTSHHCQQLESSGAGKDGGIIVAQQSVESGVHSVVGLEEGMDGDLGKAVSCSQHSKFAEHPPAK